MGLSAFLGRLGNFFIFLLLLCKSLSRLSCVLFNLRFFAFNAPKDETLLLIVSIIEEVVDAISLSSWSSSEVVSDSVLFELLLSLLSCKA